MDKEDGILLSHKKKKNEIIQSAAIWMDLEIIILSEVSQTENKCMILLIRGVSNMTQVSLIYETETDSQM